MPVQQCVTFLNVDLVVLGHIARQPLLRALGDVVVVLQGDEDASQLEGLPCLILEVADVGLDVAGTLARFVSLFMACRSRPGAPGTRPAADASTSESSQESARIKLLGRSPGIYSRQSRASAASWPSRSTVRSGATGPAGRYEQDGELR